jgi:AraC-like DNA-binding protein
VKVGGDEPIALIFRRSFCVKATGKIVEIALGVGFENQAHFTTVFGNFVGMTPRQFQCSSGHETGGMFRRAPEVEVVQSW